MPATGKGEGRGKARRHQELKSPRQRLLSLAQRTCDSAHAQPHLVDACHHPVEDVGVNVLCEGVSRPHSIVCRLRFGKDLGRGEKRTIGKGSTWPWRRPRSQTRNTTSTLDAHFASGRDFAVGHPLGKHGCINAKQLCRHCRANKGTSERAQDAKQTGRG